MEQRSAASAGHSATRPKEHRDADGRGRRGPSAAERDADVEIEHWVEQALTYVPTVARRFMGCGVPFDELLAAGNLGLVQAALRFDPARGIKFVTYADWWIRKAVLKAVQEQSGPVRLPRYRLEQMREIDDARRRVMRRMGREPSSEELATATGRSAGEVDKLLAFGRRGVSLEQPVGSGEGLPLCATLADDPDKGPQTTLLRRDSRRRLRRLVARLGNRERRVLMLRFGFGNEAPRTLREVGHRLGISRERVRQIERRAIDNLRELLC